MTNRLYTKISLFLLLLVIIVLSVPSSVSALLYQDIYVLVAYDEEWEATSQGEYGYSPETLAHIIVEETSWRFSDWFTIRIKIAGYTSWDSYDNPTLPTEMLDEVVEETGFVSGTTTVNGYRCDILIAFTDQEIPGAYGIHSPDVMDGAVLVQLVWTWTGGQHADNILQHELSHLYDCGHHEEEGLDCVMSDYAILLPFPDWLWIPYGLTTENWCSSCDGTIMSNRGRWGYICGGGGGGGRPLTIP